VQTTRQNPSVPSLYETLRYEVFAQALEIQKCREKEPTLSYSDFTNVSLCGHRVFGLRSFEFATTFQWHTHAVDETPRAFERKENRSVSFWTRVGEFHYWSSNIAQYALGSTTDNTYLIFRAKTPHDVITTERSEIVRLPGTEIVLFARQISCSTTGHHNTRPVFCFRTRRTFRAKVWAAAREKCTFFQTRSANWISRPKPIKIPGERSPTKLPRKPSTELARRPGSVRGVFHETNLLNAKSYGVLWRSVAVQRSVTVIV